MQNKRDLARERMREIAERKLPQGDLAGFFDEVYATAKDDASSIPWADMQPHPLALEWFERERIDGSGKSALVIGCGLGDDAEELARRGFRVTAFDFSPRAIAWCQQRFPGSAVNYQVNDLFAAPAGWRQAFDFVLEIYTVQATPLAFHARASASIASFVAPGGRLLVVCRAREAYEEAGPVRWPLTRAELQAFTDAGLKELSFEDVAARDGRHFRVVYGR
jgi:SAM-dependent methyltransferase